MGCVCGCVCVCVCVWRGGGGGWTVHADALRRSALLELEEDMPRALCMARDLRGLGGLASKLDHVATLHAVTMATKDPSHTAKQEEETGMVLARACVLTNSRRHTRERC